MGLLSLRQNIGCGRIYLPASNNSPRQKIYHFLPLLTRYNNPKAWVILFTIQADFETSTFLFWNNVQYAHSFEPSSQPFFSVCSNSNAKSANRAQSSLLKLSRCYLSYAKVSNILDTTKFFAFFIAKDKNCKDCYIDSNKPFYTHKTQSL